MERQARSSPKRDLRVLVVAPRGKDAQLLCDLLGRVGILCETRVDTDAALGELSQAGAIIIAEEALTPPNIRELAAQVHRQPAWSDFPLILLTTGGEVTESSLRQTALREPLGNILLLERPIRPETLVGAVQSALRARRRQYDMRDQLEELRSAHDALLNSEKLAVAGRLAASIAHEINNPLAAVMNLLFLARTNTGTPDREKYLVDAEKELVRVADIANQTLKFYRQPTAPTLTNVSGVLESVLSLYQGKLRHSTVFINRDFENAPPITAFEGELRQLFANLIGNSLDAMNGNGKLILRVRPSKAVKGDRKPGVRVVIADNGCGIPPSMRSKIFEPFVSTKENTGTGLGLWVSSKIVAKHGGTLRLRSRVKAPSGTVISISLPSANLESSTAA
ncbi:MAG: sensor histidine kinase [Candidatus Korobacteraceae bacterium]